MRKTLNTLFAFVAASSLSFAAHTATVPLDGIAAVVNEDVVLTSELDAASRNVVQQIQAQGQQLPPMGILREQVLERLILTKIQKQRAERMGIRVDEANLTAAVRSIAERNNMTLREFAEALRADGMDYLTFRNSIRDEMVQNSLRQAEVDRRITVTEREIDDAMEAFLKQQETDQSYHLQHIMVAVPEAADPEMLQAKQAKANDVLTRLANGEQFSDLAIAYSDGQRALEGGDLGWRKLAEIPSLFAEAVTQLKAGEHSSLIRSGGGFHIIRIAEQRGGERHFTDEVLARHILIAAGEKRSEQAARDILAEVQQRLAQGEDFATLAKEYSDDPGSGAKGGDLGWSNPAAFVPEFSLATRTQPTGEIGRPVKTQFGFHLIKVVERRTRDTTDETRRAQVQNAIFQRKANEETTLWQQRLRDEAFVELR